MPSEYSELEMMAVACARRIQNEDIVFCGTGLPLLAAMTAKMTHAPQCVVFFETGALDPALLEIPLSVADPRVMHGASHNGGLIDAFSFMQNRRMGPKVIGILSGAQIDCYGNINSTAIGDYRNPSVRLPGSGGACDVASLVGRTRIFMKHEIRRFVEKLDYITSPGWMDGGNSRTQYGLRHGGPELVITSLGTLAFDYDDKRMYLQSHYAFSSPDIVSKNTGFEIDTSQSVEEPIPTDSELATIREKVDPFSLISRRI